MISNIKLIIGRILCSAPIGNVIRALYGSYVPYKGGIKVPIDKELIRPEVVASLYFSFYEKAERTMIKRHIFNDLPVIELGASIGVISTVVAKQVRDKPIISLEAVPALTNQMHKTLKANGITNVLPVNAAYAYQTDEVKIAAGRSNLTGKISGEPSSITTESYTIKATSLQEIRTQYRISGPYQIVCDIEGAEIEVITYEDLSNCERIIIELHDTTYNGSFYTYKEIADKISNLGFKEIDKKGRVYVFSK